MGNPGWGWKDLLPFFEKSVNYLPPDNSLRKLEEPTPFDPALAFPSTQFPNAHAKRQIINSTTPTFPEPTSTGSAAPTSSKPTALPVTFGGGPMALSYPPFAQPFGPFMIAALTELGIKQIVSFCDGSINGVQYVASTLQQAFKLVVRSTTRTGYLRQAEELGRLDGNPQGGSLTVFTNAFVKKILFEKGTSKAIGILFNNTDSSGALNGSAVSTTLTPLYATREVIISTGSFRSPQLLMVSGVGPKAFLRRHKIPVVVDLPGVGQGMQDHVFFGPTYPVGVQTLTSLSNRTFQLQQLQNYTDNDADMIAFETLDRQLLKTIGADSLAKLPQGWPHLEYILSPGFPGNFSVLTSNPNTPEFPLGQQYATITAALVAPQSRGNISISSGDMNDFPIINPNWLTHPVDEAVAVAAFRRVRQFWSTSAIGTILDGQEIFPGPNTTTTSQILNFVRANLMTVWHASCTCSMKPRKDGGVLDSRLRVYGTKNLRVIDASSFPMLPPGHPQSTLFALAEKASELIKEDHGDC
ncbi:hypothetical protein MNV49_006926 [Pseudohyphozyma bogoriensis]|nr:hypothetical protein MNV49_006926 [Pseudohyphozyma bogoriensis]